MFLRAEQLERVERLFFFVFKSLRLFNAVPPPQSGPSGLLTLHFSLPHFSPSEKTIRTFLILLLYTKRKDDDLPVSVVQGQSPALAQLSLNYDRGCLLKMSAGVHLALSRSD